MCASGSWAGLEIVLNPKSVRFRNPELTLLGLGIVMVYTGKQKVAVTPKSKAVTCVLCPTEQISTDLQSTRIHLVTQQYCSESLMLQR